MRDTAPVSHARGQNYKLGSIGISLVIAILVSEAPCCLAAQHVPDASAGSQLAQRWCSNCHVVGQSQGRGTSTGAPPFAAVAEMPSTTAMSLRAFLMTPHGRMPDLHLTRDEIDDVSAYILSLRRQ
jgi:mono/diheme cytochrome c family protein